MAVPLELRQKQRTVIEFLVSERDTPVNVHRRLQNVFEENTLDNSNVCRWVCRPNDEKVGTVNEADKPPSGRPTSSVNPANKAKAHALIREDRRTNLDELAESRGVSHGSTYIVESLGLSKGCASWVPGERKWLKEQSTEFYEAGIYALIRRWNGDYVET